MVRCLEIYRQGMRGEIFLKGLRSRNEGMSSRMDIPLRHLLRFVTGMRRKPSEIRLVHGE